MHHLAISLMELGHNVLLAGPGSYRRFRHLEYPYSVLRWPRIPFLAKELTWRLLLRITRMRFKWDVVHAHTTYPNGFTAAQLKEKSNFPLIITPHGADIHKVPEINFGHRLDPEKEQKISYVEKCIGKTEGPILAASDYMRAHSDQIRPYIQKSFYSLGTDGFGRSDTRKNLRKFFEVDKEHIVTYALSILSKEQLITSKYVNEAIKKYNIKSEREMPTKL